jgi:hypothetical protein
MKCWVMVHAIPESITSHYSYKSRKLFVSQTAGLGGKGLAFLCQTCWCNQG